MLVSLKHNFIFLSTPKCASNSIEILLKPFSDISFLGSACFRHTNYRQYKKFIQPYLKESAGVESIETICLIREPLSWLNSYYRYSSRHQLRNPKHPKYTRSTYGVTFPEFIEAYMSPTPPTYASIGSQFNFVKDESNEVGIDKIFPYENIDAFLRYMSHKVGKKLTIGYYNTSPRTANKSNFGALVDRINRKVMSTLNIKLNVNPEGYESEVPVELSDRLRVFTRQDFELHERACANFPV